MDLIAATNFHSHTLHSILMVGIFGAQVAVTYFAWLKYMGTKDTQWFFLVLAGSVFGMYSFLHAVVVPDVILFSEALFDTFEHYGLFLGSGVLLSGALLGTRGYEYLYHFRRTILLWWIVGNSLCIASFIFWQKLGDMLYVWVAYATGLYGIIFLFLFFLFFRRFRQTRKPIDFFMAIGLLLLAASGLTPFFYEEWNVLWWLNHLFIFLGSVLILAGFLLDNKEGEGIALSHIPFYRKVKFKLTVLILVIIIPALSLLGFYSFYISENALQKQTISDLELLVRSNNEHVDAFLYLLRRTASNFSSDGFIRRSIEEASISPQKSKETLVTLNQYLVKNKQPLDPYLIGINIFDTKGEIISSTNRTEIGKNESEDEYFIEGIKLAYGESFITDYGKSSHFEKENIPMITTVAPLIGLNTGKTLGIIATYFKLDDVSASLSKEKDVKKTLDIYLVNSAGLLISDSRFAGGSAILSQVVNTKPTKECKEKRNTSGTWTDWRGEVVYGASICFTDFPFRWTLIAEIQDLEVDAPVEGLKNILIVVVLLFIVAIIFIVRISTDGMVNSLEKLSQLARKINQGDLNNRVEVSSTDEVGELSKDLDMMRQTIKMRENDLVLSNAGLEKASNELNEKVIDLGESKKAVLNLLEDIEAEKERVDELVVLRTQELNTEKARLLASIKSLSFGFIIADTNDKVIVKNPAISTILELSKEPISVQDIVDSFKGVASGLDVLVHSCRECINLKKVVELKEILHGKKYLRVFCTPILVKDGAAHDAQEKTIGYVMLVEDITEAKVMERSRDEFFAVASHELRTPLTAIRGNADMMLEMYADKIVDKDMKEMLQDIDISSIRLISVVNDFLEVSRLEQGKVELKKENFDILEVAGRVVRDMKAVVEEKGLSLTYTPPESLVPLVYADKNKTEQVLLNLLGNAAKFTGKGGVTLDIVPDAHFITIRVTDTGDGISGHNQTLLFRKFQQAGEDMLARDVTQSTGLGLYISKLIVASMGGTIGLEKSELGKGSTFFFTLPVADEV